MFGKVCHAEAVWISGNFGPETLWDPDIPLSTAAYETASVEVMGVRRDYSLMH